MSAASDRHALLRQLHQSGFRDLRALADGERPIPMGFAVEDVADVDNFADTFTGLRSNVYCGVASRLTADGRSGEHCDELRALFVDIDFKDSTEQDSRNRLAAFPLKPSAVVASGGGLQVYWFLDQPFNLQNGGAVVAKDLLRRVAGAIGGDLKAAEPARILRLPGTLNFKYDPPRPVVVEHLDEARRYDPADFEGLPPVARAEPKASTSLADTVTEGGRNETLFREACRLRRLGWSEDEMRNALVGINASRCNPPLDADEVAAIARSASRYEPVADDYPLTETGDAEFFAACNGDTARFDHRRGRWLLHGGDVWQPQTNGEVARLVLDAMRARQTVAAKSADKDRKKWAIGGEARKRQVNALEIAKNLPPIADAGDSWDLDPWLLGTPAGIVDLRTGTLRPGRPEDRITMQTRAAFDPEARCPLFDQVVNEIFLHDAELIAYVDRFIGYSLTGDCREEALVVCWGEGANGKGTLMNTIGWLLGDYADDLPFSAFELHNRASIPNDIAKLVGKRFVTSSETGETQRLNEARIKALTGRDPITARFLHREFFTFQPEAKFWLATNHRPEVRDDSDGFWRRIHLLPFEASFIGREDRTLKERLRDELPGIFARAVRGCLDWQRVGLNPPDKVKAATEAYRHQSTPLAPFVEECCELDGAARVAMGQLFNRYREWAGEKRMGRLEFIKAVRARFAVEEAKGKGEGKGAVNVLGVRLAAGGF